MPFSEFTIAIAGALAHTSSRSCCIAFCVSAGKVLTLVSKSESPLRTFTPIALKVSAYLLSTGAKSVSTA